MSSYRSFLPAALIIIASLIPSCSIFRPVGGVVSDGYENTVAYFNSYYNASRLFDEAEDEILTAEKRQRSLDGFADHPLDPPGSASTKLSAVIDKCSNILSFQPGSALVDDALFLIGKSYFYQAEFLKAERKFSELLEFAPSGPLALEASLWRAKTLSQLKNEDGIQEARTLIQKAIDSGQEEIAGEANLILGHFFSRRGDSEEAIAAYQEAARLSGDEMLLATAQFRIGDERMKLREYAPASEAFLLAGEYSEEPGLYLAAHQRATRAQREAGNYDAALELSRGLAEDYRFINNGKAITFETALTLMARGDEAEAAGLFSFIDTTENKTELGARAAFELGGIHENAGDYRKAQVDYSRAAGFPVPAIYNAARGKAAAFNRYLLLKSQRAVRDSILLGLDTTPFDSLPPPSRDSLIALQAVNAFDLGEVFYADLEKADSAEVWYRKALEELKDDERTPRILFILAELSKDDAAGLYGEIIRSYPRSHYAVRAKLKLGLKEEAAGVDSALFVYRAAEEEIELGDYQSAIAHLKEVVETYPQSSFAAKSTYTLGWLYEHRLGHPDTALSFYQGLVEHFGTSEYAAVVRARLQPATAVPDSLTTPQGRPKESDERRREDRPTQKKSVKDKEEVIE